MRPFPKSSLSTVGHPFPCHLIPRFCTKPFPLATIHCAPLDLKSFLSTTESALSRAMSLLSCLSRFSFQHKELRKGTVVAPSPTLLPLTLLKKYFPGKHMLFFSQTNAQKPYCIPSRCWPNSTRITSRQEVGTLGLAYCLGGRYTDSLPIWQGGTCCRPNGVHCKHQKTKEIAFKAVDDR